MTEAELDEIEARLKAGDTSRRHEDLKKLIEEVRTLRGFITHAEEAIVQEVVKNPPLP
jgi:hypothetical protein